MTRKLYCRVCGKETPHAHGGVQAFPRYTVVYWNCKKCGATSTTKK